MENEVLESQELSQDEAQAVERALQALESGAAEMDSEEQGTVGEVAEVPEAQVEVKVPEVPAQVEETPAQKLARLEKELAAAKAVLAGEAPKVEPNLMDAFYPAGQPAVAGTAKNHQPPKRLGTARYKLLSKEMDMFGKVPQQQADLAKIISGAFAVDQVFTDTELNAVLNAEKSKYPQLANSKQDVYYLFRYYRGLNPKDGKHLGFIGRNFLAQV